MNDHTDQLDRPAVELIFRSLVDAFPCSEKEPPPRKEKQEQGNDRLKL